MTAITNPLGLDVEWREGVTPLHDADDAEKLAALTASMAAAGWNGAPIVANATAAASGQDNAYTGSHRLAAWAGAHDDPQPVPCVWIEDLAAACGIGWATLMAEHDGDDYEAAYALCCKLPADVLDAYGLHVGGA